MIAVFEGVEIWSTIADFPNYEVSAWGNIRRKHRTIVYLKNNRTKEFSVNKPQKVLSLCYTSTGYHKVELSRNLKQYPIAVHRLVAKAFIPNPENKCCVNHINGIKSDNRVENLEWATSSENNLHAFATGLSVHTSGHTNPNSKLVLNLETGIFYESAQQAADAHSIKRVTLHFWLNNKYPNRSSLIYV